jgi:hypothetical protein
MRGTFTAFGACPAENSSFVRTSRYGCPEDDSRLASWAAMLRMAYGINSDGVFPRGRAKRGCDRERGPEKEVGIQLAVTDLRGAMIDR